MIKVSVIIPIYNMAQYLPECLDSIVQQTLQPIEIIAVDDGSTDHSLSILNSYTDKYSNISILTQENQGPGPARNNGIRHAKGKYLIFMDPDDFYPTNDCLEALYNAAEEKKVFICGGIIVSDFFGEKKIRKAVGGGRPIDFHQIGLLKTSEHPTMHGHQSYLFRTDMIKENNIYYPPYRRFQDPPFMLKALICAGERYGIDKVVYNYRSGHKKVHYTLQNSIDVLNGIRDVIKMSKQYNLIQMYDNYLKNINKQYAIAFYMYSFCGHNEIDDTIEEINEMIGEWIGDDASLIVTKEDAIQMREDCQKEYESFLQILSSDRKKIIYGAGVKARKMIGQYENNMKNVIGVAVTKKSDNSDDFLCELPLKKIEEYLPYKEDALIIIATMSKYHEEIEQNLKRLGFKSILKMDEEKLNFALEMERIWMQ